MTRFISAGLYLLASGVLWAQQYVISTVAGGAPPPTAAAGVDMTIAEPYAIATDTAGNVYFTSAGNINCLFKLDRQGIATRVAGTGRPGYSGDGGPATSAQLNGPRSVAVDGSGNVYIGDGHGDFLEGVSTFRIRRVAPNGIITTVAGGGNDLPGDGGPATGARLQGVNGLAADAAGNLFIADGDRIRKVSTSGIITTVAGGGDAGYSGDGGLAASAQLNNPVGVAVDNSGNLFISDTYNYRVRKVSSSGIISTVAGGGGAGLGDGGAATSAVMGPFGLAVDAAGNIFIGDVSNYRIRKVSSDGMIATVVGGGTAGLGDGGPATSAQLGFYGGVGVALDGDGNLFIAEGILDRIRKVSTSGIITTVAGGNYNYFSGDEGPAASAQLLEPYGVAVDSAGNLFIADTGNERIRRVTPNGIITTVAGNGTYGLSGDGGPATNAQLDFPTGLAVDGAGNLFIAEYFRVRKVSPGGIITTVAGNGTFGFSGDGGPATSAQLEYPAGLAVDGAGNLFIADTGNGRIRKVSSDGIITTVAGNGIYGFSGDGGPATSAALYASGIAVDRAGNLLIASTNRVRQISRDGIITTVAGNGTNGLSGDGGPATSAAVSASGIAVDGAGNLLIADGGRIRRVSSDGIITTIAGKGTCCYSGDGGPAKNAQLQSPASMAVDGEGNVYVADASNDCDDDDDDNAIRVLRPVNQSVLIGAVLDAASESAVPVSPGKIIVIYGVGLGPTQLIQNQASNGQFSNDLSGTTVSFNGIAASILYTSDAQIAAIVPYSVTGTTAQVAVTYQGQSSTAFTVPVALSAPSIFTSNQTGAGQAAAVNDDGTVNTAANPAKIGGYISLYATGEGQTAPGGVDGKLGGSTATHPLLPVSVTIGGIPATVQFKGGAPGEVAGLMQVNVQIPNGVQPGGYVPVVLQVGDASTTPGAVWIAVSGN